MLTDFCWFCWSLIGSGSIGIEMDLAKQGEHAMRLLVYGYIQHIADFWTSFSPFHQGDVRLRWSEVTPCQGEDTCRIYTLTSSRPAFCRWCAKAASPSVPVGVLTNDPQPENTRASKISKPQIINSQPKLLPTTSIHPIDSHPCASSRGIFPSPLLDT